MTVLLTVLVGLMIVAAVIALQTRERISSIVALGAVGFLVAIAFLLLGAPDVAKTQILVEILSLLLLLRVTSSERREQAVGEDTSDAPATTAVAWVGAGALVLAGVLSFAVHLELGEPVMARLADTPSLFYLERALSDTGAANVVSAVLLDFRAYDTLGEATVLFTAVIGTLVLLRKRRRSAPEGGDAE